MVARAAVARALVARGVAPFQGEGLGVERALLLGGLKTTKSSIKWDLIRIIYNCFWIRDMFWSGLPAPKVVGANHILHPWNPDVAPFSIYNWWFDWPTAAGSPCGPGLVGPGTEQKHRSNYYIEGALC